MSKIVTYVIQLPESNEAKTVLNQGNRALVESHGGVITAYPPMMR